MAQDPKQQQVASMGISARQLVMAGPGTGKTETVALRLSHLLESGVGPAQILVLSFSRSAVRTVADRLERVANDSGSVLEELRYISIRTFDSWTFRLLRQLGDLPKDLLQLSYDRIIDRLTGLIVNERRDDIHERLGRVRHVIIDEFQDLSGVRASLVLELLDLLAPPTDQRVGFTILGDEAQAIYGFAFNTQIGQGLNGMKTEELLRALRARYQGTLLETNLKTNYRAVPGLAQIAVLLRRILRKPTSNSIKLKALKGIFGEVPALEQPLTPDFLRSLDGSSTAILTRTNGEALRVWQRIMGNGCEGPPVRVMLHGASAANTVPAWVGATLGRVQGTTITRQRFGSVYKHLYAGDGATRAEALAIPEEETAWRRLLRAAQQPDANKSLDLTELRSRIGWPDQFPDDQGEQTCLLNIMTVHQSKGREFTHVMLLDQRRKTRRPEEEEAILEEASVLFVGLTRAGKTLRRISGEDLKPLRSWSFMNDRRKRWGLRIKHAHDEVEFHMEIGHTGDVETTSFIDARLHASEAAVAEVQMLLAENPADLIGRKTILCKLPVPGQEANRFIYTIHLEEDGRPGKLLGATSPTVTLDLLRILNRRFNLPAFIRNLRITDVVTHGLRGDATTGLAEPWSNSGFWLGLNIHGVGEFVPSRRQQRYRP